MAETLPPISARRRFSILQRDGFSCQYCGRHPGETILEVDHVHPRSRGGSNDDDNLITSCRACNQGKSDRVLDETGRVHVTFEIPYVIARVLEHADRRPATIDALRNISDQGLPAMQYWGCLWELLGALDGGYSLVRYGVHNEERA